ncbi:hypothetical protein CC86DRAFT_440270, partial [Ophiobolus disseminans]
VPKPDSALIVPSTTDATTGSIGQEAVLQTPVTPVTAEDLMSLQNLILTQDARALCEKSRQDLQRHNHIQPLYGDRQKH